MIEPSDASIKKIETYVKKYREKSGTSAHPDPEITNSVVKGLAANVELVGRPLCPCNFYPDKKAEVDRSREWICACDEMKKYKYCHCLLFATPEGLPITEYLPEGHDGITSYGIVKDPTPEKGRESAGK